MSEAPYFFESSVGKQLLIRPRTSKVVLSKFGIGEVIYSHTLLGMCLFIHICSDAIVMASHKKVTEWQKIQIDVEFPLMNITRLTLK